MDIQLYYTESGSGFPLILLHGNGEDHTYFVHQFPCFSKKYRVIAIDTRGHGKTPRGTAVFSIEQFADDLKSFLDVKNIKMAHILGFSDGGNIAMVFAIKYPEYVRSLVLNGANLYSQGVKPTVQIPIIIEYKIAKLFSSFDSKAKQHAELLGLMVHDPHLTIEDLKKIHSRTLVIAGTKDMIKKSHTKLIYRNIVNAELVFITGDHFIANKNPEIYNHVVMNFFEKET